MKNLIKQWWLPAVVLVIANIFSGKLGSDHLNQNGWYLDSSIDEWMARIKGADCSFTLEVAKNYAEGKGLIQQVPNSDPPTYQPFCFWGPGAPWGLGTWLWLTGGQTMWSCFFFSALSQFLFGVVAIATAAIYTRRMECLVVTAFFAGFCPAMMSIFYSWMLPCSEIVALVPTGLAIFALAKAFQLKSTPDASVRTILIWFSIAGVWLGVASLSREVLTAFGSFVCLVLVAQTGLRGWRRIGQGIACSAAIYVSLHLVRVPVQIWNKDRIGHFCVNMSGGFSVICRGEWWQKHDTFEWAEDWGVGFGEYLDPEAPARVEAKFAANSPWANLNCLWELSQAIYHRPYDAVEFKVSRWPILLVNANREPKTDLDSSPFGCSYWCIGMYVVFLAYVVYQWRTRTKIPEIVWLFPLFAFLMSFLAHSEFRYGLSSWHGLVLVPGLLWDSVRARGVESDKVAANSNEPTTYSTGSNNHSQLEPQGAAPAV